MGPAGRASSRHPGRPARLSKTPRRVGQGKRSAWIFSRVPQGVRSNKETVTAPCCTFEAVGKQNLGSGVRRVLVQCLPGILGAAWPLAVTLRLGVAT